MSLSALYREPLRLDPVAHRHLRLTPLSDHSAAAGLHGCFVAVAEFTTAARDYPVLFVRGEVDGDERVEPVVLLGVEAGENLFVDGTRWDCRYVPAYVRRYPFGTMRVEGQEQPAVTIDRWWRGFSETEGEPLYVGDGQPAPRLAAALEFIANFEVEAQRTFEFCDRLQALELLRPLNAEITLASGRKLALDGLLAVDDAKLLALPDAQVVAMHRNGMLPALHAHLLSLANLQSLVDRKAQRLQAAA
ncbi:MAG TPA: SapC family protein [Burkholderiaceae bacterium]|nr:SapC family protein [Burkholderiaceae bacterium]